MRLINGDQIWVRKKLAVTNNGKRCFQTGHWGRYGVKMMVPFRVLSIVHL